MMASWASARDITVAASAIVFGLRFLGCAPAMGQPATTSSDDYEPAKLWDNETPDFRGIWQVDDTAYVNIEGHPGGERVAPAHSIVVDPLDGKIPYKPEAIARRQENYADRATADPVQKCFQAGIPRTTYLPIPLQIVQSPGNFAIVYQYAHSYRIFYPDSRPHMDGLDQWMGDTRYRWEGNTLVSDVVALVDQLRLDEAGNYHTNAARVEERYTMIGPDTLQYAATIEDPSVYTRPWTLRTVLHRNTKPGARIIEDECLEDDNGVRQPISPYDPRSLLKNDYRRWEIMNAVSGDG